MIKIDGDDCWFCGDGVGGVVCFSCVVGIDCFRY